MPDLPSRSMPSEHLTAGPSADGLTDDKTGGLTDSDGSSLGKTAVRLLALANGPEPVGMVAGYELLDEVGRGGMGVVYRARDVALGRDVAVKLLQDRFPADGAAARRFAEEARITGQLQHPGIPPVHQAGATADGRPFLAMKLIKGGTLDEMLKDRAGSPNLVAVFEGVCQAVGYAHAHGVVHRDLKPANVMVGSFGEVQVMDWGLAKVLAGGERPGPNADPDATSGTEITPAREAGDATQAGSLLGTPAYMAPEQAIGAVDQIDARTDVFGLGGILCAVLTGRPPFVGDTAESTRQLAARVKLDDAFGRLDAGGADPELVALCKRCLGGEKLDRPADGGAVAKAVADLRAAADDRARQAELDRVRADGDRAKAEAVARGERKRQRLVLAATAAIGVVLTAGAGVSLWQADRADRARADAVTEAGNARKAEGEADARATAERAARDEEARQRATVTAVKDYFRDILGQADAAGQLNIGGEANPRLTVREALDRATARLDGRFTDQPLVEAEVRMTIAEAYCGLEEMIGAEANARRAADLYAEAAGPDARPTLAARMRLGVVLINRRKDRSAAEVLTAVQATAERAHGPDHPLAVDARFYLGMLLVRGTAADRARGEGLMAEALAVTRREFGPAARRTAVLAENAASAYLLLGRPDRAEPLLAEAVATLRRTAGPKHPLTLNALTKLGEVLRLTGRPTEAESLLVEALALLQEVCGDTHKNTILCLEELYGLYYDQGRYAECEPLLVRALAGRRAIGSSDFGTLTATRCLAMTYLKLERLDQAEPLLRELCGALDGLGHRNAAYYQNRANLGYALGELKKYPEAEAILREVYEWARAADLPADEARTLPGYAARDLAVLYARTGRPAEAAKWLAKLPPGVEPRLPIAPPPRPAKP